MSESHVVAVSLLAAFALFATFFATWYSVRRLGMNQFVIAVLAPILAGTSWFVVVAMARSQGWVRSDEAQFHHLYVLGVVGMPLVGVVVGLVAWFRPAPNRRTRLSAWAIATVFIAPAAVGLWATHIEPQWLRVDHVRVSATSSTEQGADSRSDTIRVGVIADIQTDGFGGYEDAAIDRLLAEEPDLILVAGDMTQVDSTTYDRIRADGVAALARLHAPYGVFVITGNTDIGGGEEVRRLALDAGLTPLIDEIVEFDVRGRALRIGGLSWPNSQRPAAQEFVADFATSATPEIIDLLLAHSPDAILHLPDRELTTPGSAEVKGSGVDLVVSGHTHGGQIALPFIGPFWNVTELPGSVAGGGLHEVGDTTVYVSTGVGVQRGESPKVRFGVRPSIGILEL